MTSSENLSFFRNHHKAFEYEIIEHFLTIFFQLFYLQSIASRRVSHRGGELSDRSQNSVQHEKSHFRVAADRHESKTVRSVHAS